MTVFEIFKYYGGTVRWSLNFSTVIMRARKMRGLLSLHFTSSFLAWKVYNSHRSDLIFTRIAPLVRRRFVPEGIRPIPSAARSRSGERSLQLFFMPRDIFLNLIWRERVGIAAPRGTRQRALARCVSAPRDISRRKRTPRE